MRYDPEQTTEDFRRRANLAEALYRKNCERLGAVEIAAIANDEIVAHWRVCDFLSVSPFLRSRTLLLSELRRMRVCGHPEAPLGEVLCQERYDAARDKLLAAFIEGYLAQAEGRDWREVKVPLRKAQGG